MSDLYLLGTGCGVPTLKRGGAGILLSPEMFLFDIGRGTIDKLLRLGVNYCKIKSLFFTHYHPDHTAELVSLLFAYKDPEYGKVNAPDDFYVYGPPGLTSLFQGLESIYGNWVKAENYRLILKEIYDEEITTDTCKIYAYPTEHTASSVGYRIELGKGKIIAYSGDTGYSERVVKLAKNADYLILECSLPEEKAQSGHLTPSLAGKIAEEAGSKRLILTHFYPVCEKINILERCRKYYSGEIILGEDLMKFTI